MEKLSLDMLSFIDDICRENDIRYYVTGKEAFIKGSGLDEIAGLWNGPATVAMPREDFGRFDSICRSRDLGRYFYQSAETDPEYRRVNPRLRLRLTFLRENRIPRKIESGYNDGFYVNIVPMDMTFSDKEERQEHIREIRRLNNLLILKWTKRTPVTVLRLPAKKKLQLLSAARESIDGFRKRIAEASGHCTESEYYIDSTGYVMEGLAIRASVLGKGTRLDYQGHEDEVFGAGRVVHAVA